MAVNSIDGISSGLNTTEIVDALLSFEKTRIAGLQNDTAERTNIISSLQALQAKLLALNSTSKALTRTSTFEGAALSVSDTSILTARTNGKVGTGSYTLQVQSIARNHQIASQGIASDTEGLLGSGTISIKVGSGSTRTITIDNTNNSLNGLKKAINDMRMGVTATIINDGSSANSYRLLLTADKTGLKNSITFSDTLSGGSDLNFETATFDAPEKLNTNASSTSAISLGATAANSGTQNKIYTFTVAGSGSQTVGSDVININWTDGTNSGSLAVTQADTEVNLVGAGADGLKLSFADGTLNAGDTFQVASFAPLVQSASDAKIAFGGTSTSGSPITVTSDTNTFSSVIPGVVVSLLKETEPGETVTINADRDLAGIKTSIQNFIDAYNSVSEYIKEQGSFDNDTKTAGALFGDFTLSMAANSLSTALGSKIAGIESNYNQLYSIGIRTTATGKLAITDNARLEKALNENIEDVIKLFSSSGSSSSGYIEYFDSTTKTKAGQDVAVDITRAATQGALKGATITKPESTPLVLTNSNNRLRILVDGLVSDEIILTAGSYATVDSLIEEIQGKINEDSKIGSRNVKVEWEPGGASTGNIKITSSTYGSSSKVSLVTSISNSAFAVLGLATGISTEGLDVEGTLNGEAATGKGQVLTGKTGNKTTEGLAVKVTLTQAQLDSDTDEATVTIARGVAGRMQSVLDSLTLSQNGIIDRKIKGVQNQVDDIAEQIEAYNKRMEQKRQSLFEKFYAMEEAVGQLNSQGQFLSAQLSSLTSALNQQRSGGNSGG